MRRYKLTFLYDSTVKCLIMFINYYSYQLLIEPIQKLVLADYKASFSCIQYDPTSIFRGYFYQILQVI